MREIGVGYWRKKVEEGIKTRKIRKERRLRKLCFLFFWVASLSFTLAFSRWPISVYIYMLMLWSKLLAMVTLFLLLMNHLPRQSLQYTLYIYSMVANLLRNAIYAGLEPDWFPLEYVGVTQRNTRFFTYLHLSHLITLHSNVACLVKTRWSCF